jgi:hypothetical protein
MPEKATQTKRTIKPTKHAIPPNAFEAEFGEHEKKKKEPCPISCFRKGQRVGAAFGYKKGLQKGLEEGNKIGYKRGIRTGKQGVEKEKKKSTIEKMLVKKLTHKEIGEMINNRGLTYLKQHLKLNDLNKDEVRSLAVRLTGTENMITGYSKMTLPQLKNELVQRGYKL